MRPTHRRLAMMHLATRTAVLAAALAAAAPAFAKQPAGTAAFEDPDIGTLAFSAYSFGVANTADPGGGGGGGAGKAVFSPFTLVRPVDAASAKLFQAAATGKHIPSVTIVVATGVTPVTYRLSDVIVSAVQDSGAGTDATESLSLSFATIVITPGG
jgi:type VI protein secretion system component Hcp